MGDNPVRLGLLRLTDAAPVIHAQASGLFGREGVAVSLHVEPSWANIADKLAYGLLEGAVMLPPLALAMHLGLRGPPTPLIVPASLSLNGNSVVLASALAATVLRGGHPSAMAVAQRLRGLLPGRMLRIAVVHAWSTHDLLVRYWLAAAEIDPDRDLRLVVLPPSAMVGALAQGEIDGFCAGAPWGAVAAEAGVGRAVALSSGIWRNHPEKCLAVRTAWAESCPAQLQSVLRALLQAGLDCDRGDRAASLAALLAGPSLVDVPARLIEGSLPGGSATDSDRSVFAAHGAQMPDRAHAAWFLRQMARWRDLPPGAHDAVAIYRPDLQAAAARQAGLMLVAPEPILPSNHADGAGTASCAH
ncbi:MAG: ABC transporter substrate-binding protein [Gemmatimonadaceae bacterium]|nr:ABC transporter substrate-binding protein [Acetobacteraceae bacterium]